MKRTLFYVLLSIAAVSLVVGCAKQESKAPANEAAKTEQTEQKTEQAAQPAAGEAKTEQAAEPAAKADEKAEPAAAAEKRITGPVAKVNGIDIAAAEFYAERDKITSRNAKIPEDRLARIEQNILKRLVEKELIKQAVEKSGIKVEDSEIDEAFNEYKKRFQTEEQFENYLRHGRVTVDSIKDRLREKRALEKLIESKGNLSVTDDEAKEFYEKNQRFYVEKAGVRASHVLIKVPEKATKEQEDAAMAKIKKVQAEIKAGKDFGEIAKQFSEGPSAPKGGDLGFFGPGQMVKPFEEKAFAMKVGEISEPVRTRFGFHIIKVVDKREERRKPFDEVKEQIEQSLKNKKFFQERRNLLQSLRQEAKIEEFLPKPPPPSAPARPMPHPAPPTKAGGPAPATPPPAPAPAGGGK